MYNKILLFAIISVVIAAGCSKNPVTWQAVAGTVIAMVGVAVLFWL